MTGALESTTQGGQHASVGLAFQIALGELPEVNLYADDGSHPSPAGSFLAACVLSEIVGGEYARVPPRVPLGLDRDVADALCAIAPRVACSFPSAFCHGVCVQTASDPLHCGACDAACPGDLPCTAGVCACPYPEWSPCPGRYCAHLGLDQNNCGACGHTCEPGNECRAGACECLSMAELTVPSITAWRPGCVPDSPTVQADCAAAIAEYCGSLDCFDTGVPSTPIPASAPYVTCLSGEPLTSTFEALRALEPGCTGPDVAYGPECATAVHRACVAAGAVSGLPATSSDATGLTMTCVRTATVVRTTFADLGFGFCDGTTTRSGAACSFASSMMCRRMGHAAGYGPIAAIGDDIDIVCVDR